MKQFLLLAPLFVFLSSAAYAQAGQIPLGAGSDRIADAKQGDARLLVTDGFRPPLERVRKNIEAAIGHPLLIEYSESHVLQREMDSQPFELALVTSDVIAAEISKGVILPDPVVVARIRIGVFQRGRAPLADVSTPGAFKKALLSAKSISWSAGSAADPTAQNVLAKLGIADALKERIHTTVMGRPSEPVALGPDEYELRFNAISETASAIPLAGEVPRTLEVPAVIPAGIGAHGNTNVARQIVKFLMAPAFTKVLNDSKLIR